MEFKTKIAGLLLLMTSFGSSAITLGRVQGVAFLGQPLDVAIQVQFDVNESPASSCFDADVFHADTRIDGSRVRVTVENVSQSQLGVVRVLSTAAIDEPIVTVYLKVGCSAKTTRRYVLFAEIPNDIQPSSAAMGLRATPLPLVTAPVATTAAPTPSLGAASSPVATPAVPASVAVPAAKPEAEIQPKAPTPIAQVKPKPVKPLAPAKPKAPEQEKPLPAPGPSQSRLKLDTLELLKERIAQLESTPAPAPAPTPEAEAETLRLKKLEVDVQALLALASSNEKNLSDLRERLQKAESSKYDNALVYALIGLLLLVVGTLVYVLRTRKSSSGPGSLWTESVQETASVSPRTTNQEPVAQKPASIVIPSTFASLDVDLSDVAPLEALAATATTQATLQSSVSQTAKFDLPPGPERRFIGRDFSPSVTAALRSINSEELFDIRQQAEFFVSLGQTEQAIKVLKNLILDGGDLSPLVYLDLLKIFHNLGRTADFLQLSQEFNHLFNGRVPEFEFFGREGKDLESYRRVVDHISALWPSPKVLEALEECIYRDDVDNTDQFFDLAAFRDLILLHAVAVQVIEELQSDTTLDVSGRRLALTKEMPTGGAPTHFDLLGNAAKTQTAGLSMAGIGATRFSSQAPELKLTEVDFDFSTPYSVADKEGLESVDTDFELPDARKQAASPGTKES